MMSATDSEISETEHAHEEPNGDNAPSRSRIRVFTGAANKVCDLAAWHALGRVHDRHRTLVLDLTGRAAMTIARPHAARLQGHTVHWLDLSDRRAPVRLFALPPSPWRARLAARIVQTMASCAAIPLEAATLRALGLAADALAGSHPLGLRTVIRAVQSHQSVVAAGAQSIPQRAALLSALSWGARFPAVWGLSEGDTDWSLRHLLTEGAPVVWLEARLEAFEPDEHRIVSVIAEAAAADAIRSVTANASRVKHTVVHVLPPLERSVPSWVIDTARRTMHVAAISAREAAETELSGGEWLRRASLVVEAESPLPPFVSSGYRLHRATPGAPSKPESRPAPVPALEARRATGVRPRALRERHVAGVQVVHVLRRHTADFKRVTSTRQCAQSAGRMFAGDAETPLVYDRLAEIESLRVGWLRVADGGARAAGVDGQTLDDFRAQLEPELQRLSHELRTKTYRPKPVRRVFIPKGVSGTRPLGIAALRDKVVQAAAVALIEPRLELEFSPFSFAFRPGRNAHQAVATAIRYVESGLGWALHADVKDCYEALDHAVLLEGVRRHLGDLDLVELVNKWITAGVVEELVWTPRSVGTPQGLSISPLLCNLYLDTLDKYLTRERIPFVRFADDIAVFAASQAEIEQRRGLLMSFLRSPLRLQLNAEKTAVCRASDGLPLLGFVVRSGGLSIEGKRIDRVVDHLRELLGQIGSPETSPLRAGEVRVRVDAVTRGWRNYFLVPEQAEIAVQLAGLYATRAQAAPGAHPDALVPAPTATPVEVEPSLEVVDQDGRLHVFAHRAHVGLLKGRLLVTRRKGILHQRDLEGLELVHLEGRGQNLSVELELRLAELGVPIVLATGFGPPAAVLTPLDGGRVALRGLQVTRREEPQVRRVGAEMLAAKVGNQAAVLRYFLKYRKRKGEHEIVSRVSEAADRMAEIADTLRGLSVEGDGFRAVAMGHEGRAAAFYWAAVGQLVGPENLPRRETRGALTPVNIALNYGYGMLYGEVWRAVVRAGLDPWFGVMHGTERDRGSLVFDLIEELRAPIVDRLIIGMLGRGFVPVADEDGRLQRRCCRLIAQAFLRQRQRSLRFRTSQKTPAALVDDQARAFARFIEGKAPYQPFRMRW